MAEQTTAAEGGAGPRSRRRTLAALGAVLLVAAALTVILTVGGVRPPAFPSLSATPDPSIPGHIAFTTSGADDGTTCLELVDAGGGEPTALHCVDDLFASEVAWASPQLVVLRGHDALGTLELTVEADDGRIVERRRLRPGEDMRLEPPHPAGPGDERADGAYVVTAGPGSMGAGDAGTASVVLVEPDGSERRLVSVEGPSGYAFTCAQFSPDGRWVLVGDDTERLLIVNADAGGARVLATEATHAAWQPEA